MTDSTCLLEMDNDNEVDDHPDGDGGYILGTDFGSTSLSIKIYDTTANVVAESSVKVVYVDLPNGALEIDPIQLWLCFVEAVRELLGRSNIDVCQIKTAGFSFAKATVMFWDKDTGQPRCNLISWQDTRCSSIVDEMNQSYLKKTINILGSVAYAFYRTAKYLLMKVLEFQTTHSSMKVAWLLKNDPQLASDVHDGKVLFGALDTWILWKLTNGGLHATDFSSASGTGMFDPYLREWSIIAPHFSNAPLDSFPTVLDTSGFVANIEEDIFGAAIPITAIVADSQAGVFGLNCFKPGEISCIMGTGCFIDINTGSYPHASIAGLYPQIGWKIGEEVVNLCEGQISGIAPSIEWAKELGMFDDLASMANTAKSIEDTDGVYYVPGFSGLTAPHKDPTACAGLIGMKRSTTKSHIVRAILEGIAFRFLELYQVACDETRMPFRPVIKVSGGISNNEFVMELISSLTNCTIEKLNDCDVSVTGAVYLAGLGAGIWKDQEEIASLPKSTKTYEPDASIHEKYMIIYKEWLKAVTRCLHWYT